MNTLIRFMKNVLNNKHFKKILNNPAVQLLTSGLIILLTYILLVISGFQLTKLLLMLKIRGFIHNVCETYYTLGNTTMEEYNEICHDFNYNFFIIYIVGPYNIAANVIFLPSIPLIAIFKLFSYLYELNGLTIPKNHISKVLTLFIILIMCNKIGSLIVYIRNRDIDTGFKLETLQKCLNTENTFSMNEIKMYNIDTILSSWVKFKDDCPQTDCRSSDYLSKYIVCTLEGFFPCIILISLFLLVSAVIRVIYINVNLIIYEYRQDIRNKSF